MSAPIPDAAYLEALVPVMRALGVSSFRDVVLGPDPQAASAQSGVELTTEERTKLAQKTAAEREERMRFGTSGGFRLRGPSDR